MAYRINSKLLAKLYNILNKQLSHENFLTIFIVLGSFYKSDENLNVMRINGDHPGNRVNKIKWSILKMGHNITPVCTAKHFS